MIDKINNISISSLEDLSLKIRDKIVSVVSKNGGHLSSPLGAVDIIVAMHHVFDVNKDPFIFDVSHQAYAHKLLTNRWDKFDTLRQIDGIGGFTNPKESKYDYFVAGHSSTSISLGVGCAKAIALENKDSIPVCLIGDGSMSAGLVYEALNELGDKKYPLVIILNDNEMSISKPIGYVSKHLSKMLSGSFYQNIKKKIKVKINDSNKGCSYILRRMDEFFKLITPGMLFEKLGIEYIGPIDGHNMKEIIDVLSIAKKMNKPVLVHIQTTKGKGYKIAEGRWEVWHGVGSFDVDTGEMDKKSKHKNPTAVFSEYLLKCAKENEKIVGITAAMPMGTGMNLLMDAYPDRFFDVAIAEQHGVTSMASMAKNGFKPFVAIYSTFLQRAYDQIIHDVCILDLPVVFAIDRAGIVGEDGETHQGMFDVSYLRSLPNMIVLAPRDNATLQNCIDFSIKATSPCAFRFPRGKFLLQENTFDSKEIKLGLSEFLIKKDNDSVFIGFGNGVGKAYETLSILKNKFNIDNISLVDLVFVKPLDDKFLLSLSKKHKKWFIFSDSVYLGGVASALMEWLNVNNIYDIKIKSFEYKDNFITHGNTDLVEKKLNLDAFCIANTIVKEL